VLSGFFCFKLVNFNLMQKSYTLSVSRLLQFLNSENISDLQPDYDEKKNIIQLYDTYESIGLKIRLPWYLPPINTFEELMNYLRQDRYMETSYLIILIQAGYGAVGRCKNRLLVDHKITYLHKKGKSRAGSRIRLAQTVKFFEDINDQANLWIREDDPDRLLISCSPRLWGLMFQSKIKPLFDKKDERLFRIPLDINTPDQKEIRRINEAAKQIKIETAGENHQWVEPFIQGEKYGG